MHPRSLPRGIALAFLLLTAAACGGDDPTSPDDGVATVDVVLDDATLEAGDSTDAAATLRDASNGIVSGTVAWTSTNEAVATVHPTSGRVTAVGRGTTNIRATSGSVSDEAPLTVVVLYRSITAGGFSTCDIASGGRAFCWGENFSGQLGDDSQTGRLVPVPVAGATRFTQVSMYSAHTCALSTTNAAWCWGGNSSGQLGTNQPTNADVPTAVVGGIQFTAVTAGDAHSCGLDMDGDAYCWGNNVYGQLGNDSQTESRVPVAVAGGHKFSSIDAGDKATCAVTTTGVGYCWGSNVSGALGTGAAVSNDDSDLSDVPVLVAGGHTWRRISSGARFTCGVTTGNVAYCWGDGGAWIGNDDPMGASVGTPTAVVGGGSYKDIDAGFLSTCAIATNDAVWCWGVNLAGQLGANAPVDNSRVPVLAAGGLTFSEVSVGGLGEHACGISLDRLTVRCWGRNDAGQLGNNTTSASTVRNPTPVIVSGQN